MKRNRSSFLPLSMLALALCGGGLHGAVYHVAPVGDDTASGLTPADSLASISTALGKCADGDQIIVEEGVYVIPAGANTKTPWITVDKNVTIIGKGGPEKTILDGEMARGRRGVEIAHPDAVFSGFTIRRVYSQIPEFGRCGPLQITAGMVTNCVIRDNRGTYSDGVGMDGGLLVDSLVAGNTADDSLSRCAGVYLRSGSARVERCEITGNHAKLGTALYMTSVDGVASRCKIHHNENDFTGRGDGGAIALLQGTVERCEIVDNKGYKGAGVSMSGGVLRGCLVARNLDLGTVGGGGIHLSGGLVESCTITANGGSVAGRGVRQTGGKIVNSLVVLNGAEAELEDPANYLKTGGEASFVCAFPRPDGEGNRSEDPCLRDFVSGDYRLSLRSPCRDAGLNAPWMEEAVDLAGTGRIRNATVDLGAYELVPIEELPFCCDISTGHRRGVAPYAIDFEAKVYNAPAGEISCRWDFGDGTTAEGKTVTKTYAKCGTFTVSLTVEAGTELAVRRLEKAVSIHPARSYVSTGGAHVWPFDTPEKASTNLQAAIDVLYGWADPIGVVEVAPGTYPWDTRAPMARLAKSVIVRSSAGPEETILDGRKLATSRHCVEVSSPGAVFSGFTIRRVQSSIPRMGECGPLQISAGQVTNCIIRDNNGTWSSAVGMDGGLLVDSIVRGNRSSDSLSQAGGIHLRSGKPLVLRCEIAENKAKLGAGVYLDADGAVLRDCHVHHNLNEKTGRGTGGAIDLLRGLVENCKVVENNGTKGAGVCQKGGILRGSLIARNHDVGGMGGGGVYLQNGRMDSCTVVANDSLAAGQGVCQKGGTIENSIIIRNGALGQIEDADNYLKTGGSAAFTCGYPVPDGEGNWAADPRFVDFSAGDYHLGLASPCRDAGANRDWMTGAKDLDGHDRIVDGLVDRGAYEIPPAASLPFSCDIEVSASEGIAPLEVTFRGLAINPPGAVIGYYWDFGDGTTSEGEEVRKTYLSPGVFTVTLTVATADKRVSRTIGNAVTIGADHLYVATDGAHIWPFDTWAKAATNIQAAVDAIYLAGLDAAGVIEVGPGTYRQAGEGMSVVMLGKRVLLKSTHGPVETIIDGEGKNRGLWLNHGKAVVSGFGLTRCRTTESGAFEIYGGTLTNCHVYRNGNSYWPGGLQKGGRVTGCVFTRNISHDSGHGFGGSVVRIFDGEIDHCVFTNNTDLSCVGGVDVVGGTVRDSLFAGNRQYQDYHNRGGALFLNGSQALVERCVITNNLSAGTQNRGGGGVYLLQGTLRNCLVAGNQAVLGGGGIYMKGGRAENLTITGNRVDRGPSPSAGALVEGGILLNSIVHGNEGGDIEVAEGTVGHSCCGTLVQGAGNIAADPVFRAPARNDYTIRPSSPCIDAGENQPWMDTAAVDLAGSPRIYPGGARRVDMGAYEGLPPNGFILILR